MHEDWSDGSVRTPAATAPAAAWARTPLVRPARPAVSADATQSTGADPINVVRASAAAAVSAAAGVEGAIHDDLNGFDHKASAGGSGLIIEDGIGLPNRNQEDADVGVHTAQRDAWRRRVVRSAMVATALMRERRRRGPHCQAKGQNEDT